MQFHLLSCEGPDAYACAGGLAIRMTGLCHALAEAEYETHLWFVGDPTSQAMKPSATCVCIAGANGSAVIIPTAFTTAKKASAPTMQPRCRRFSVGRFSYRIFVVVSQTESLWAPAEE